MNNNINPAHTIEEALGIMRELRERLERQQKLLEQLQTQLGQQPPEGQLNLQPAPLTPGWMPTRDNEGYLNRINHPQRLGM